METNQPKRIHPLMAGAAASVMLVSLVATAAMTGLLPSSHGTAAPVASVSPTPVVATAPVPAPVEEAHSIAAPEYKAPVRTVHRTHTARHTMTASAQPAEYAPPPPPSQQPAPVAQNSAVGIGVGAVVGGLVGSRVGKGNGRTLATIAGAVGGGYIGNEIAKNSQ